MAYFIDRATVRKGKARITPEGYFVADALVARANNIQEYSAGELGLNDRDPHETVRVFRPESEVFAVDSLRSASRLPVTLDHPPVMVDASNWREYAKGESGEEILRDGEYVRVPIRVTDAQAVDSVQHDRQEFSMGYTAEVVMGDGSFQGQAYDATATNIRYNHLAACRAARGGPELRITDERPDNGVQPMPKIVLVDSAPVDVSNPDTAETVVRNLLAARDTANATLETTSAALADSQALVATRDAEIATLRDAAKPLTAAQLRDAAASYARATRVAEAMGVTVADTADIPAIHAAVVNAKVGDTTKGYTPEQYAAAFDVLAAGVNDQAPAGDPLRDAIGDVAAGGGSDPRKALADARAARLDRINNGHRGTATAAN